jgi:hypothetical protein
MCSISSDYYDYSDKAGLVFKVATRNLHCQDGFIAKLVTDTNYSNTGSGNHVSAEAHCVKEK